MTAARQYKNITGGMSEAVARMRRADTERAARLAERLVELEAAMVAAHQRAAITEIGVAGMSDRLNSSITVKQINRPTALNEIPANLKPRGTEIRGCGLAGCRALSDDHRAVLAAQLSVAALPQRAQLSRIARETGFSMRDAEAVLKDALDILEVRAKFE